MFQTTEVLHPRPTPATLHTNTGCLKSAWSRLAQSVCSQKTHMEDPSTLRKVQTLLAPTPVQSSHSSSWLCRPTLFPNLLAPVRRCLVWPFLVDLVRTRILGQKTREGPTVAKSCNKNRCWKGTTKMRRGVSSICLKHTHTHAVV